jgi:hypothetical protein
VDTVINTGTTAGWLWAGVTMYSANPLASAMTVRFDDFMLHNGDSVRPLCWYAYRDPVLPGNPDMGGADALVRRIKPAYTHAAAIAALSCICDELLNGRCDAGPCE